MDSATNAGGTAPPRSGVHPERALPASARDGDRHPHAVVLRHTAGGGQCARGLRRNASFVHLRYANQPGGFKYCHNTKLARCSVSIVNRSTGASDSLLSEHGGLLEFLDDNSATAT
jgi:hypothetical protein